MIFLNDCGGTFFSKKVPPPPFQKAIAKKFLKKATVPQGTVAFLLYVLRVINLLQIL